MEGPLIDIILKERDSKYWKQSSNYNQGFHIGSKLVLHIRIIFSMSGMQESKQTCFGLFALLFGGWHIAMNLDRAVTMKFGMDGCRSILLMIPVMFSTK